MNIKARYKLNKEAKVGDICFCPSCNEQFTKANVQQAFCRNKPKTQCKDKFYNSTVPTKKNNTSRISPASRAFMANKAIITQERIERYWPFGVDEGPEGWNFKD